MKNDLIKKLLLKIFLIAIVPLVDSANILAILPSVWRSHYIFSTSILQKLASNGHNITVITGLSSIDLHSIQTTSHLFNDEIIVPLINQNWIDCGLSFDFEDIKKLTPLEYFTRMVYASTSSVDIVLSNRNVQDLIRNPDNKFDLIIGDIFIGDAYLGFTQRFNCPLAIISPIGNNKWIDELAGNPNTASRNPSSFLVLSEEMNLAERIQNTLMNIFEKLSYNFFHFMYQEKMYEKFFKIKGTRLPPLKTLIENVDLVLLNSNPVTEYPNAYLPHIIEIGGAHINTKNNITELPLDLFKFIDEAVDDVVYISFGANLNTGSLPDEKLNELFDVIKELEKWNIRVILRWEKHFKPYESKNIFYKFWLPQQKILAHPKVRLFITTGGSLSIKEAVFTEKLILGIPILPQQEINIKRLQNRGYGAKIENYDNLNATSMLIKIQDLLTDEQYHKTNKIISDNFKNVPINPLDLSTYYIELLINEGGLSYLKPVYNKLNFIQRELIDVIIILLVAILFIVGLPSIVICFILHKNNSSNNLKTNRKNSKQVNSSLLTETSASSTLFMRLMKTKNFDIRNRKLKRN